MVYLPIELLEPICYMASTDGQTGAALALLSRSFHEVSRRARFHAVSLHGRPAKIDRFLATFLLERTRAAEARSLSDPGQPPAPKLKVRHLSITWCEPPRSQAHTRQPSPDMSLATEDDQDSRDEIQEFKLWRCMQPGLDVHYTRAVSALLAELADDLHTLTLVHADWSAGAVVLERPFPVLRELTLLGGDPPLLRTDGDGGIEPSDAVLYPALEWLHHVVPFKLTDVNWDDWAVRAPHITHIRMSCVRDWEDFLLPGLKEVLKGGGLKSLRYVCVEKGLRRGDVDRRSERLLWEEARRGLVVGYLVDPRLEADSDLRHTVVQRMRKDWQDSVEGRPGVWGWRGDGGMGTGRTRGGLGVTMTAQAVERQEGSKNIIQ